MSDPVKKIRIKLKGVTAHVAGPDHCPRFETYSGLTVQVGNVDIIAVPPGQPFQVGRQEPRVQKM